MSSEDDDNKIKYVETEIGHRDDPLSSSPSIGIEHLVDANRNECIQKAFSGECATNPGFMFAKCASECIHSSFATTVSLNRTRLRSDNQNHNDESIIQVDIGVQQRIHPLHSQYPNMINATLESILKTKSYMQSFLPKAIEEFAFQYHIDDDDEEEEENFSDICVNNHAHCHSLAAAGKCVPPERYEEDSPETEMFKFMMRRCAPACQTCQDLLEYEHRVWEHCQPDRSTDIFQPGDVDRMFERIVEEGEDERSPYSVHVLSRPTRKHGTSDIEIENDSSSLQIRNGPWIITIDNFITDEECNRLIELGSIEGYGASSLSEEDDMTEDEIEEVNQKEGKYRTSTNAWCQNECYQDPIAKQVITKIENLTGIPDSYHEYMQLVRYVPGQYYKSHHDTHEDDAHTLEGPRILTVFMYLNDVEEGGATRFNDMLGDDSNIYMDVLPRKGTALIWPSVLNESPNDEIDVRTFHEAMEVIKGVKYGANVWLHLRQFKDIDENCDEDQFDEVMKMKAVTRN